MRKFITGLAFADWPAHMDPERMSPELGVDWIASWRCLLADKETTFRMVRGVR